MTTKCESLLQEITARILYPVTKLPMSAIKNDFFDPKTESEVLRWEELREREAQVRDEILARQFWAFKFPERVV